VTPNAGLVQGGNVLFAQPFLADDINLKLSGQILNFLFADHPELGQLSQYKRVSQD
jgi:hypothetical protein